MSELFAVLLEEIRGRRSHVHFDLSRNLSLYSRAFCYQLSNGKEVGERSSYLLPFVCASSCNLMIRVNSCFFFFETCFEDWIELNIRTVTLCFSRAQVSQLHYSRYIPVATYPVIFSHEFVYNICSFAYVLLWSLAQSECHLSYIWRHSSPPV